MLQAGIDDMASAMAGATRQACTIRFENEINGVIEQYEKVNRLTEIVKRLDVEASAFTNVDGAENIEYDELNKNQDRRENIDKEIERATTSIMSALNKQAVTTPCQSAKDERYARIRPMSIPIPLEDYGIRMIHDYDPDSGLWWSWSDISDKDDEYLSVPECFRPLMKDQNRQLYADIKTAMAKSIALEAMWSHINAVHILDLMKCRL